MVDYEKCSLTNVCYCLHQYYFVAVRKLNTASLSTMLFNASRNVSSEGLVESCYKTYVVRIPTTSYIINSVIGCVANAILAVLGTFLNALVVRVFWKTPRLQQKISYFMIMVLSSIDLCVSIVVHPFHLVNSIAEVTETSKCFYKMFYQTSVVMLSGMSYLTFFVMNIERYLSFCSSILP